MKKWWGYLSWGRVGLGGLWTWWVFVLDVGEEGVLDCGLGSERACVGRDAAVVGYMMKRMRLDGEIDAMRWRRGRVSLASEHVGGGSL